MTTLMYVEGEEVALRDLRRSDVDEMCRWPKYTEPEFLWANFDAKSELDRDIWFAAGQGPFSRRFVILDKKSYPIGLVGLRDIDARIGQATLGIRMSPAAVNRGHGTDAICALLGYAFTTMGLHRVNLDVAEDNPRARRCYEKCGFSFVKRRVSFDGNVYVDMTIEQQDFFRLHRKRSLPRQDTNV